GATDVTGFGLTGHLHVALRESGMAAELDAGALPFLPGVMDLAAAGMISSGTRSNHEFVAPALDWGELSGTEQMVVADAQTSGGLLIAVPDGRAGKLGSALAARGIEAPVVGVVRQGQAGAIRVRGRLKA